jgi:hypothetical protein
VDANQFSPPPQSYRFDSNMPDVNGSNCLKELMRICIEFGQKAPRVTNRTFKPLC